MEDVTKSIMIPGPRENSRHEHVNKRRNTRKSIFGTTVKELYSENHTDGTVISMVMYNICYKSIIY